MNSADKGQALEAWFREHGGYLNPSVNIAYSHEAGYRVCEHRTRLSTCMLIPPSGKPTHP